MTYQLLPQTEGGNFPFWSPDNHTIAFFTRSELKRIDTAGGPAQRICDVAFPNGGGTWNREGVILFSGTNLLGIFRVSAAGGEPRAVLQLDKSRQETAQLMPQFLPDGRHFVYSSRASKGKGGIYAGLLDSKETWRLSPAESNASYAPPGILIYSLQETVVAHSFDPTRLQFIGDAVPIAERVSRMPDVPASLYSVSQSGVLVYRSLVFRYDQLAWHDRDGKRKDSVGELGIYEEPRLSPDEKKLVLSRTDPATGKGDTWILEIGTGILSRLTLHTAESPIWSADGRELVYSSTQQGKLDLYRKVVGGSNEELVFQSDEDKWALQGLKDGSVLFESGKVFYRLRLSGARKPVVLLETEFDKDNPRVSPDERWVAYQSTESGRWEVYVASFPSFGDKRQVSNGGGYQPQWRRDGKELFYLSWDGKMMSVDVKGESSLATSSPRALFLTGLQVNATSPPQYVAAADGKRFLFGEAVGENNVPVTVVLNWTAGLKR
jgi:Tol biopolymer transport system component